MEKEKLFRFRWKWNLLMALSAWIPAVVLYEAGLVGWKDVTFAHTLIWPVMVLVTLAPFSFPKLVDSKWLMPIAGVWASMAFPGVYIGGSWVMGWVNHCGKLCVVGGVAIFLAFNALGAITTFRHRWVRAIGQATI